MCMPSLTHFSQMLHLYTPWKCQKTQVTIEMEYWAKMGLIFNCFIADKNCTQVISIVSFRPYDNSFILSSVDYELSIKNLKQVVSPNYYVCY